MDHFSWQLQRCREAAGRPAVVWRDREVSYETIAARCERWLTDLADAGVTRGDVVAVVADYSPASIACLLALGRLQCILVPLSRESRDQHDAFCTIAGIDHHVTVDPDDGMRIEAAGARSSHELIDALRRSGDPGLILFTSGSTGTPKAILHALPRLLEKFRTPRSAYRTLNFLLFDHIGGFNTLFYTLANLGCSVVPAARGVTPVCEAIARHRVELLPASPSFLNLLLMAEAHRHYDLSSLRLITYGTEVMPERTLRLANEAFPGVRFQQTYGLSELGILRSKSASNQSLLVKVGGDDYETRVVDGTLRIRARSSMLGYLNAPTPFDADGWFDTGDAVIEEDGYYRILGRHSEIINVGGQKVYPAEVEKVIAEVPGVLNVTVSGEPHLLLGQVVVATVQMTEPVPAVEMKRRIAEHGRGHLQPYMIPARVRVVSDSPVGYRFKKVRT